jgi:hypothetical protein
VEAIGFQKIEEIHSWAVVKSELWGLETRYLSPERVAPPHGDAWHDEPDSELLGEVDALHSEEGPVEKKEPDLHSPPLSLLYQLSHHVYLGVRGWASSRRRASGRPSLTMLIVAYS